MEMRNEALCKELGEEPATIALAWLLHNPVVSAPIIGPRTMAQLDGLLAGAEVTLDDALLDRIDAIVPPGTDVAPLEGAAYAPPAIVQPALRRRPVAERAAA